MHLQPHRVSRARRSDIREFLETRNATIGQIARRFFPSDTPETARKKASRWLCKEQRRKRVRVRGTVILNATGRPQVVYGRRCKEDQLEHEVWITEAELLLGGRFTRSAAVGKTTADALLVRDGTRFFIEVDNQTMTAKQMRDKWERYGNVDGYILVVCHTKARLRRLIRSAALVKSVALFTRFRWLQSARVNEPWIDWDGKRVRI
jgi:hypothetical protein